VIRAPSEAHDNTIRGAASRLVQHAFAGEETTERVDGVVRLQRRPG
jgi:hypothetical protein